jgi:hypothetical protein
LTVGVVVGAAVTVFAPAALMVLLAGLEVVVVWSQPWVASNVFWVSWYAAERESVELAWMYRVEMPEALPLLAIRLL